MAFFLILDQPLPCGSTAHPSSFRDAILDDNFISTDGDWSQLLWRCAVPGEGQNTTEFRKCLDLHQTTMADFTMADVTDSMLDGVIAGFPMTYASKVGKTNDAMYRGEARSFFLLSEMSRDHAAYPVRFS